MICDVATARTPCPDFEAALAAARAGDDRAFAVLWRWLHPSLGRWLRVVANDDVEDVESEVWMSVTRGLTSFAGAEDEFRRWVFTIARRRAIDAGRRRRRQPQTCAIDTADLAAAGQVDVDDHLDGLEAALALLRQLNPQQREIVALRVIVGLDVRETAHVIGSSEGAVRIACHRGLRTLARQLSASRIEELVV
jgi:RNA polymerase sigma-70 factor (ECF subfamily)